MKKSIINRNYSLLVLILLILYITYINIPNTSIMKGGAPSNPYDSMPADKLEKILEKKDSIFMVLNKYFYVYIIILIILIGLTIYYIYKHAQLEGMPGIVDPVVGWDNEGGTFLTQFFILDRQNKGLNPPGSTTIPDGPIKDWDPQVADFVKTVRPGVDLFCNIVAPCDICSCSGPDPSYAGDPKNAPTIPYGGSQCKPPATIEKFTEHADGTTTVESVANPADKIKQSHDKFDFSHRIRGTVPTCCCHLFDSVGINIDRIDEASATAFAKIGAPGDDGKPGNVPAGALEEFLRPLLPGITDTDKRTRVAALRNDSYPVGLLPEVGCEPNEVPKPLTSSDGTQKTPNNGLYALSMFQACLSDKKISYKGNDIKDKDGNVMEAGKPPADSTTPNAGLTPYQVNKTACGGVAYANKIALDRGHSKNSIYRNNDFFNALKDILKKASEKTPVTEFNIKPFIGVIPTAANSSYPWSGPAWPDDHPAFEGDGTTTAYFYKKGAIRYELKIDNYLKEVYAYPFKPTGTKTSKNSNSTIELIGAKAVAFIEAGLQDKYIDNSSQLYKGTYIFP
jgi:hypothetical protein